MRWIGSLHESDSCAERFTFLIRSVVMGLRMSITYHEQPPTLVPVSDQVQAPDVFTAEVTGSDLPGAVTLVIRVRDGVPRVEQVTLTGTDVTSEKLRAVKLARLRDLAVAQASFRPLMAADGTVTGGAWPVDAELANAAVRGRRRVIDDAHLREVAEVYQAAVARPVAEVAARFRVPRATAARWVSEARGRELLPRANRRGGKQS